MPPRSCAAAVADGDRRASGGRTCRRPGPAPIASSGACSSRAPTRTARFTPRPRGLDPVSGRSRWRSRTRAVQRRATLDHVIEQLAGRPRATARAAGARDAAARADAAAAARWRRRARRGRRVRQARQARRAAGRRAGQRGACAGRPATAPRSSPGSTTPRRRAPRCCTRFRCGWRGCGSTSSGPSRRARCWRRSTSRRSRRCGSTRWSRPSRTSRARLPVPAAPAPGLPYGAGARRRRSTPTAQSCGRQGAIMPQSRGSMTRRRRCSRPQPGERVLDLCSAPGAKATQLAALMGATGELVCVEVNSRRADGLRRTLRRMHADAPRRCSSPTRRSGCGPRSRLRPGSGRSAVQRPGDAAVAAGSALAHEPRAGRRDGGVAGPDPGRGRGRGQAGRRLVYSVCTISPCRGRDGRRTVPRARREIRARSVRGLRSRHVTSAAAATLGWHRWVLRRAIPASVT